MVYNDISGGQGIVQDAYFEASADSISYPIEDVTRHANQGLDEMVSIAINSNGTWQFDDTNNTDLPIGTTALVTGQPDYTFDNEYLTIEEIRILPSGATNWSILKPVDRNNPEYQELLLSYDNISGTPEYYDKFGETIMLYPKPNYSQDASLKAFFQRKASYFSTTDTTKEPGFPKHLHKFIPLFCAFNYASAKELSKKNDLFARLERERARISKHFSRREKDIISRITSETINSI